MKIVILTAMDKEKALILEILNNKRECIIEGLNVISGVIGKHTVWIAKCGIGKVNAALSTFKIIKGINPDLVINSGVAGGAGLPVGAVLIADKVAYDDVWCGPGTSYGEADGCPLFFEPCLDLITLAKKKLDNQNIYYDLICTGDKFISNAKEISFIRSHFPDVKAVDMESAAIAQTCFLAGIPFNIIRVVSDTPGEGENISQYQNFWKEAPEKTFHVVKVLIENI